MREALFLLALTLLVAAGVALVLLPVVLGWIGQRRMALWALLPAAAALYFGSGLLLLGSPGEPRTWHGWLATRKFCDEAFARGRIASRLDAPSLEVRAVRAASTPPSLRGAPREAPDPVRALAAHLPEALLFAGASWVRLDGEVVARRDRPAGHAAPAPEAPAEFVVSLAAVEPAGGVLPAGVGAIDVSVLRAGSGELVALARLFAPTVPAACRDIAQARFAGRSPLNTFLEGLLGRSPAGWEARLDGIPVSLYPRGRPGVLEVDLVRR